MWWVRYVTRDGIFEEPVFEWRYEAIRNSLEKDVAVLIVSEADAHGEYAGMYSIEDVVPMEDLPDSPSASGRPAAHSRQAPSKTG